MVTIIEMPTLSPTMEKGKVVKWCKEEGEHVAKGEVLFEVETDKANVEIESYVSGFLRKHLVESGNEVPVNTPIAVIADTMEEDIAAAVGTPLSELPPPEEPKEIAVEGIPFQTAVSNAAKRKVIKISPLARKIAQEHDIDIESLQGIASGRRITKKDIERAIAERSQKLAVPPETEVSAATQLTSETYEDIELTKMRKVIAQRLSESKRIAPHFYIDMTADATGLTNLKEDLKNTSERLGVKITLNDILIKLVAQALREFPMVNASLLDDRIRVYKAINIGVAVGIEEGLVVPVIRNADQKTISQISLEIKELTMKARNKKLLPEEYSGGSFTITNLGMFGVETFHAIINPPESAILAMGSILPKVVVIDGEITVRPCLKLSLSVDHRIVDGVLAAQFLGRVKELFESPFLMLV